MSDSVCQVTRSSAAAETVRVGRHYAVSSTFRRFQDMADYWFVANTPYRAALCSATNATLSRFFDHGRLLPVLRCVQCDVCADCSTNRKLVGDFLLLFFFA